MSLAEAEPTLAGLHLSLGIPADYARQRGLIPFDEAGPADLVDVGCNPDGRLIQLTRPTAEAWTRLRTRAARDGLDVVLVSGFRSVARQTEIIRRKLAAGQAINDILRYVAAPGFSEHHTGRAIDLGTAGYLDLEESFGSTPAFAWLNAHAGTFGFRLTYPAGNLSGIGYEPWHWCWQVPPP